MTENEAYYLSRGRCPHCGGKNPVIPGRKLCEACVERAKAYRNMRRERWRREGKCTRCGRERDDERYVSCTACREKESRLYNDAKREYDRRQYEARKEAGKCTVCGVRWAEPGKTVCEPCLQKARDKLREKGGVAGIRRENREKRRAAGLCIDCGRPSGGTARCKRCNEMRRDSNKKYRILRRLRNQ